MAKEDLDFALSVLAGKPSQDSTINRLYSETLEENPFDYIKEVLGGGLGLSLFAAPYGLMAGGLPGLAFSTAAGMGTGALAGLATKDVRNRKIQNAMNQKMRNVSNPIAGALQEALPGQTMKVGGEYPAVYFTGQNKDPYPFI